MLLCFNLLLRSLWQVFYEEELDVPLVLFNEVLDHVLRIDRIFRQPQVSEQLSFSFCTILAQVQRSL